LNTLRMGALDNLVFNYSKACWQLFFHINSIFFIMKKMLGVEPDYLLYLEVSQHWTPVRNGVAMRPIFLPTGG